MVLITALTTAENIRTGNGRKEGGDEHTFRAHRWLNAAIRGRGGVLTREKTTSCFNVDGTIRSELERKITATITSEKIEIDVMEGAAARGRTHSLNYKSQGLSESDSYNSEKDIFNGSERWRVLQLNRV